MVLLEFRIELNYEIAGEPGDFIFNIHAARTALQTVVAEKLTVDPPVDVKLFVDPVEGNRYARLRAPPGKLRVVYEATVEIAHFIAPPDTVRECAIAELPPEAIAYIYPSRYCESDRLRRVAFAEFGHLRPGYWRVVAIRDWVQRQTRFVSGSSDAMTSAVDTLVERAGVCRDFAHLMIALCRAINIPARFATGIDYGSNPIFGPTDFHAYVEAFLGGRWYLFDPSGMTLPTGLVRLGVGRDAADVSFATIFGNVRSSSPLISIKALEDASRGIALPLACVEALSTEG